MKYSISIVSHGQSTIIRHLLSDLSHLDLSDSEVIITSNIPEDESPYHQLGFNNLLIRNKIPKGFGANHNAAFKRSNGQFFLILNPDVRIKSINMDLFLSIMKKPSVGAVAPLILNSQGNVEDSFRRFPTVMRLLNRLILRYREPDYAWGIEPIEVDWTAGMFIIFQRAAYEDVGGFDHSRFFMYYEDVDICERLWNNGWSVMLDPRNTVIHDAQRSSHRNVRYFFWHLSSALRYLFRF